MCKLARGIVGEFQLEVDMIMETFLYTQAQLGIFSIKSAVPFGHHPFKSEMP